jgi:hypothetical protein
MKLKAHLPRSVAALLAILLVACVAWRAPAFAQTTTITTNETLPFTMTLPNPCNADTVTFSGQLHITNHVTTDASGGQHVKTHVNYQSVSGTGAPSGANYRVTTSSNETINDNGTNPQTELTSVQVVNLIGQGPVPNALLRVVIHVTINANGTTTSQVLETRIECHGPNQ